MIQLALSLALLAATPVVDGPATRDVSGFPAPDRPVAEIVSPIWASEAERDGVGETRQVFELMRFSKGQAVADIGAGSGYYTVRLSPVLGAQGRVYAQDIMPAYLAGLKKRVDELKLANVTLVQGTPADAKLPQASLDGALLIHMYHEIEQPYGLLWRLAESMKPGGRVGIVDADRRPENHGTPPKLLRCELEAVGYRQVSFRTLDGGVGYLAIFAPPAPDRRPKPADIKPCKG
jgi:predicted methyltransferase